MFKVLNMKTFLCLAAVDNAKRDFKKIWYKLARSMSYYHNPKRVWLLAF
jgi:hypothetical protein